MAEPGASKADIRDITLWKLGGGGEVEIFNFIDDHSRLLLQVGDLESQDDLYPERPGTGLPWSIREIICLT